MTHLRPLGRVIEPSGGQKSHARPHAPREEHVMRIKILWCEHVLAVNITQAAQTRHGYDKYAFLFASKFNMIILTWDCVYLWFWIVVEIHARTLNCKQTQHVNTESSTPLVRGHASEQMRCENDHSYYSSETQWTTMRCITSQYDVKHVFYIFSSPNVKQFYIFSPLK